jgi:hypothetical protein
MFCHTNLSFEISAYIATYNKYDTIMFLPPLQVLGSPTLYNVSQLMIWTDLDMTAFVQVAREQIIKTVFITNLLV